MKPGGTLSRHTPLAARTPLRARTKPIPRKQWSPQSPVLPETGRTERKPAARAETGFSRSVKLKVRTRAGNGDPEQALCEACGLWLGRRHGQVQHIVARGMGGTSNPVLKTAANGALLCGTPQSGDHGLAESRDREMGARGFWLPQGTDPRMVPMMLASKHGSGVTVWRGVNGEYLFEAPEEVAA